MLTGFCCPRVPPGCGPAAGEQRQSGQPEQSAEAGEGGSGTGQQSGAAAGEEVIFYYYLLYTVTFEFLITLL